MYGGGGTPPIVGGIIGGGGLAATGAGFTGPLIIVALSLLIAGALVIREYAMRKRRAELNG